MCRGSDMGTVASYTQTLANWYEVKQIEVAYKLMLINISKSK